MDETVNSLFYLSAVLCTDEASDRAEVVEVCAMQHPEQWLLCPTPLDHTARLLRLAVVLWPQLGWSLAPWVPLCNTHAHGKTPQCHWNHPFQKTIGVFHSIYAQEAGCGNTSLSHSPIKRFWQLYMCTKITSCTCKAIFGHRLQMQNWDFFWLPGYWGPMLINPPLDTGSWILLGLTLNAALLWTHALTLSVFCTTVCFFPYSRHVRERLLSHRLSSSGFQNQQRLPLRHRRRVRQQPESETRGTTRRQLR